jgi:hypothetical protein
MSGTAPRNAADGHSPTVPGAEAEWLVCNTLAEGCRVASNIRDCRCGAQVWVSTLMTPLVDSGELLPMCWPCHRKTGRSVTIHEREIDELTRLDQLEEGWQVIAEMNSATSGEHP